MPEPSRTNCPNASFFLNKPTKLAYQTLVDKPIRPLSTQVYKEQIGPRRVAGQHPIQFLLRLYGANILLACQKKPQSLRATRNSTLETRNWKNCWCLYRGGPTSSLSEQSRQAPQGQWYCPLAGGRVGRRQLNIKASFRKERGFFCGWSYRFGLWMVAVCLPFAT